MTNFERMNDAAASILLYLLKKAKENKKGIFDLPKIELEDGKFFAPITVNILHSDLKNTELDEWLVFSICQTTQCKDCKGLLQTEIRFLIKNGECYPYYLRTNWVDVYQAEVINVSNPHLITLKVHPHDKEAQKNICELAENWLSIVSENHELPID